MHRYLEQDGLASSEVKDIVQDQSGRMWFATRAGVSLYDGVSWRNFTISEGLPETSAFKLDIDADNRIWALSLKTHVAHVSFFDGKKWNLFQSITLHRGLDIENLSFLVMDRKGKKFPDIFIGTKARGLYLWVPDDSTKNGELFKFTAANGLPHDAVNNIARLNNDLYIATAKGLAVLTLKDNNQYEIDTRLHKLLKLPAINIRSIEIQHKDKFPGSSLYRSRIWMITDDWLGYFDDNSFAMKYFPIGISFSDKKRSVKLLPDYRIGIYVGNIYELYYFNTSSQTWSSVGSPNGLISNGANSLAIDFEKSIWISCQRGVSKIASRRFSNIFPRHGLLEDEVTAILEYEPGKIILGHSYGVTFYDTSKTQDDRFQRMRFFNKSDLQFPMCRVLDMKIDPQKNIWLACSRVGLAKIDRSRKLTWYGKKHGLPESVNCLWVNNKGDLWVGTNQGFFVDRQGSFEKIKLPAIEKPFIRMMYGESGKLRYLAGFQSGIYVYIEKEARWKNYRIPGDSSANSVYAIKKNQDGHLLIAGKRGLFILESQSSSVNKFNRNGFSIERPIYFIQEDRKNRWWFGTDNGVVRWDGTNNRVFSTAEGLSGHETNRAAAMVDGKGKLWFGTIGGLSIYDEDFDNTNAFNPAPIVRLVNLEASKQLYSLENNVELGYKQNTLLFKFRGISYLDESALRFTNKLVGFDAKWSDEKYPFQQMIRYTNLSPGKYRFLIKARNSMGVWSKVVSSPEITILKPFYEKWWFLLLLLLMILFITYTVFRFFTHKGYAGLLEQKVAERSRQLQTVEKRYLNLFKESKDTVFITIPEGDFIDINPAGYKLLGYDSKEELLIRARGANYYQDPRQHKKYRQEIERKGFVKDYEVCFVRRDGEHITTQVTATLVRDKRDEVVAYRGIFRDITQQKQLEQQLVQAQKMEAIGTLAGGIAHDFNNILGVIVGYTELALADLQKETQVHQNVAHILTAAERASDLVNQILTFSRQSERNRKPVVLSEIIEESLIMLRSTLPATIEIRRHIHAPATMVLADVTQIHQIMMNLCTNAAHAMKEEIGVLEIFLQNIKVDSQNINKYDGVREGEFVKLTVKDNGTGIPGLVLKRIFEPYYTTRKAGEGTGMGLAVIHGIVKSHNGDINVISKPGEGTSFEIILPRVHGSITPKMQVNEENITGNENILLVDDDETLARVSTQMLKRLGYNVEGLSSPELALETFKANPGSFDVVVTDLTMPRMTGIQLAREIKNISPATPIVLCSGFGSLVTMDKIKVYGITDFVMKPIIKNDLARVLRKILDLKKN